MHSVGIIHRDLKPENCMIGPRDEIKASLSQFVQAIFSRSSILAKVSSLTHSKTIWSVELLARHRSLRLNAFKELESATQEK